MYQRTLLGLTLLATIPAQAESAPFAMATVINRQGDALTVRHFIEACPEFVAITSEKSVHSASPVRLDSGSDLVLIRIQGLKQKYQAQFQAKSRPTFWVLRAHTGLPLIPRAQSGDLLVAPKGVTSSLYSHFTGTVEVGDSGAGIRHPNGRLVGMIVADIVSEPYGGLSLNESVIDAFISKVAIPNDGTFLPLALSCTS